MKTIKTYILILLAALFVKPADIMAQASTPGFAPDGVVLNKNVVPGTNPNTYTINLEAFVTGQTTTITTTETTPTDIILVLDFSGSMVKDEDGNIADNTGKPTRISMLSEAVNKFIDVVDDMNKDIPEGVNKHRLGIVNFGTTIKKISDLTSTPSSLKSTVTSWASINATSSLLGLTYGNLGLDEAATMLKSSSSREKVVIFFTDGWPGKDKESSTPGWNTSNFKRAWYIEQSSGKLKSAGVKVYSIGMFSTDQLPSDRVKDQVDWYMQTLSSNYPDAKEGWATQPGGEAPYFGYAYTSGEYNGEPKLLYKENVEKKDDKYFKYVSAGNITSVFESIAHESTTGGASYKLTNSTTVIDVVAPAFKLPDGATGSTITLQVAKCKAVKSIGTDGSYEYTFDDPVAATTLFSDIVAKVGNLDDEKQFVEAAGGKTVQVLGFDFSENYVGEDIINNLKTPRGYKLIISFPIEIDPRNPGGANVATNTEDSGIYFDEDGDGKYDQIGGFAIPHAKIPNLVIMKTGLHKDESATFYVYKLEKDGSKSQFPIVLVATQTSDDPSTPCYARAKIQEPGRYEVEESTRSWAYYISTRVKDYAVDDADKSDTPATTWNELGYGDKGAGYQAEIPWTFGTVVPEGTRSIIRNVNDFTEDTTQKGTLFSFTNKDKEKTPAHGEASKNNVFYESR